MNPVLQAVINALLKYLNDHPDQVEKLVAALIDYLIKQIPPKP
jgi:hypothetical protein